ncbi:cupin domain-containing protein [Candidatus Dojkabacteria bacterium]|uniref:Cupin domain-containing protein n=1 Tax=Candidatus Dojkabacteria bacterium TaxID=2099670 RepID=A0A955L9D7_9BACT|nr:cupin domain-containing protein [Candidatus Dojkabacteria bacterium]
MKKFQLKHIQNIPLEGTHNLPGSRKTLATKEDLHTNNIDAMTKGFLKPGQCWDWHSHDDHDELGVVLKGNGKFYCEDEVVEYGPEDVIIIPAGAIHKFEAVGQEENEFYFVRIKV